jgi:hypothetical protein
MFKYKQVIEIYDYLKSVRTNLRAYLLLVLLYSAQGDSRRAGMIIEELMGNNKHVLLQLFK